LGSFAAWEYLIFIPAFLILVYGSLLGTRMFLQDPERDVNQKNKLLKGKEVLLLEISAFAFSGGIFGTMILYKTYLEKGAFWIFTSFPEGSLKSFFPLVIICLTVLLTYFAFRESRKVKKLLEEQD